MNSVRTRFFAFCRIILDCVIDAGDLFVTGQHMVHVNREMRELLLLWMSDSECFSLISRPGPDLQKSVHITGLDIDRIVVLVLLGMIVTTMAVACTRYGVV